MSEQLHNDDKKLVDESVEESKTTSKEMRVAEVVFSLFLLAVTVAAIFEAFTYSMTAARTPLVILVPLLLLVIGVTVREVRLMRHESASLTGTIKSAFNGEYKKFNQFIIFSLWLIFLIALIGVIGHYAGVAIFTWLLMRPVGKESNSLSIKVAIGVPIVIFVLFDVLLGLRMFPGVIYQVWAGYDIF